VVFSVLLFVLHLLLVNILWVISISGCRLIKLNHLNLCVLCDCVIFYYNILCFIGDSKISIVTTNWYQSVGIYFAVWLLQNLK